MEGAEAAETEREDRERESGRQDPRRQPATQREGRAAERAREGVRERDGQRHIARVEKYQTEALVGKKKEENTERKKRGKKDR